MLLSKGSPPLPVPNCYTAIKDSRACMYGMATGSATNHYSLAWLASFTSS